MLKFEWNALRLGDSVVVHEPSSTEYRLLAGTVAMIETAHSKRGANGVGIRVGTLGAHRVLWPPYLTVHRDPPDPTAGCWRCAVLAEANEQLASPTADPIRVP